MNSYIKRSLRGTAGYVPGEQPQEEGFVKLNTNENPYPPSPKTKEAMGAAAERLRLYPDPVSLRLRRAMSQLTGISADQIMAVNGSDEALRIVFETFLDEGETAGAPYPTYTLYRVLARVFGAEWRDVDFDREFSLPPALFDLAGRVKLIFLANPNAPSGTMVPLAEVRRLAESVMGGILIVDEAYADFAGQSAVSLVNEYENVLVVKTLSKSYSLAGLRLGFLFGSKPLMDVMNIVRDSYNVDGLAQAVAEAALLDQEWMKGNVSKIVATRDRLKSALESEGFYVWPSQTNFLMCEPAGSISHISARKIYEGLKAKKVLVRYFKDRTMENRLRISVGRDDEIDAFLKALKEVLRDENR